jgi:hypothetical protein
MKGMIERNSDGGVEREQDGPRLVEVLLEACRSHGPRFTWLAGSGMTDFLVDDKDGLVKGVQTEEARFDSHQCLLSQCLLFFPANLVVDCSGSKDQRVVSLLLCSSGTFSLSLSY